MQLTDLIADVKNRLNQPSNTKAAALMPGTSGTPDITSDETITQYLNERADNLARTCVEVRDEGTVSVPIGTRQVLFTTMTTVGGGVLWGPAAVTWNDIQLQHIGEGYAQICFPSAETDAQDTPLYWSYQDNVGIKLYPTPSTVHNLVASGLATPPPLVDDADEPAWLQPGLHWLLSAGAAYMVAEKNTQNADLAQRIGLMKAEYEKEQARLWSGITDKSVQARFTMVGNGP